MLGESLNPAQPLGAKGSQVRLETIGLCSEESVWVVSRESYSSFQPNLRASSSNMDKSSHKNKLALGIDPLRGPIIFTLSLYFAVEQ
jgi:hypothetical protein